ncbi:YgiQ family radical SAM protein [candidate division KSB1 bacterium]
MFLPATAEEMSMLGWDKLDIILITGDAYIDSPFIGVSIIGKVLLNAGYRIGIIAQPDIQSAKDITRLGEPRLFWGITSGCVDSMVANYTALKKRRKSDDFTPGGENTKRPDKAVIVYSNLIRRFFKNTKPIVLGGIEASLRRTAYYDYWSNGIKRSVLFDAKADILIYGMGEKTVLELASSLKNKKNVHSIRGLCYVAKETPRNCIILPSYEEVKTNKSKFTRMFRRFYNNSEPLTAKILCQKYGDRYLIQNPPNFYMSQKELDIVYELDYERDVHPYDKKDGQVKALETIKFSITSHRGCYGECNFCSISVHQGKSVRERSENSILNEARILSKLPDFKGYILNVGGPTANMYGFECKKLEEKGDCKDKKCIHPQICKSLKVSHRKQIELLRKLRKIKGVKRVFVASGIRYDLVLEDKEFGHVYLMELIQYHVSGQLKIAPEHTEYSVLKRMGKPGTEKLLEFKNEFYRINKKVKKKQFLTYYLIAAHPGCEMKDMVSLKKFTQKELRITPEQVQIFTPTPSTYSTLMYYTETDPFTGEKIFIEKDNRKKEEQKNTIV